ncbi:MAG TPA: alpha/beta hydrolase-fold protein [Chthoniobacterales bacterium]|jgi:enterochelin esterase-like enzyme|nr:alpha/beta hydrolase-fold protein [Chthoniobacterales bacterium]
MKKIPVLLFLTLAIVGFAVTQLPAQTATPSQTVSLSSTPEATATPTPEDNLGQILPDRRVMFRLLAPNAKSVSVILGTDSGEMTTEMTQELFGLWTVTLGPFEPNLYEYSFNLDGVRIADPENATPKPQWQVNTSLLLVPGYPPDFLDTQNVSHGTVREETYYSTFLSKNRRLLVYTPPNYDRFPHAPFPVLYLYHGRGDTRYSWVTEGRLAEILDNLLAEGKAVPMIVVVPEAHAFDVETGYEENQSAVDEELFHDIIPFVGAHYNISDDSRGRAIAGLSMGGLQSTETGIVHLGYFCWIGAFSPTVFLGDLSDEFKNALQDPNRINGNLRLFEIVIGDNDITPELTEFESQLRELKIQHVYTVVPGFHNMFVWRPALYNFLQKIFKH